MNESYTKRVLDSIAEALNSGRNDIIVFITSLSAVILLPVILPIIISFANKKN